MSKQHTCVNTANIVDGLTSQCEACVADVVSAYSSAQARLTEAEGLLGEARLVAERFGYGPLAVRIDAFLAPRPEPERVRTMFADLIAKGKPGEGLYGKTPCEACGDDLTKCCQQCGREYACGGFRERGCGRYWGKSILRETWPKCPWCLPAKESRPEPAKGGGA